MASSSEKDHTSLGVLVEGTDEVDVDPLLLAQDSQRPELPPLVRREVGADLGVAPPPSEPLDEMQVVRLKQPPGDLDQPRVAVEPRFRIRVVHEPEEALLRLVAKEELHAATA